MNQPRPLDFRGVDLGSRTPALRSPAGQEEPRCSGQDALAGPPGASASGATSTLSRASPADGEVRLRPASDTDRDFFFTVRRAAFRPYVDDLWGWDDAKQRRQADQEFNELPVQIIESDGVPVGYLCVLHEADHEYLDEIALLPAAQAAGIGTALISAVISEAAGRGVPLRLSVLVNNPARRLYERFGFRVVRVSHPRVRMEWP
jgi:ribosomal protein S18 acetylase RimI-like enzyme